MQIIIQISSHLIFLLFFHFRINILVLCDCDIIRGSFAVYFIFYYYHF